MKVSVVLPQQVLLIKVKLCMIVTCTDKTKHKMLSLFGDFGVYLRETSDTFLAPGKKKNLNSQIAFFKCM